jgi:hypothetical protein
MLIFLYSLMAIVGYRMFTGQINTAGLLQRKDGSGQTSPERIQLLLATIAAAASYLGHITGSPGGNLPDVSNNWLYLMGGSSGIYALRKAWTTFSGKST